MKIISIVLLSVCSYINCFGQDYPTSDTVINKAIAQLQKKGIDTICTYQYYFPGAIRFIKPAIDTTCFHSDRADVYVLWKVKGMTYITLKNYCADYDTIRINADELWKFYIKNKDKIETEKIKPFQVAVINQGKKETEEIVIDHSPRQEITLDIDKKHIRLYFDSFNFEKTTGDRDRININYSYNLKAKSKEFKTILEDVVNGISSKKMSKKINR